MPTVDSGRTNETSHQGFSDHSARLLSEGISTCISQNTLPPSIRQVYTEGEESVRNIHGR